MQMVYLRKRLKVYEQSVNELIERETLDQEKVIRKEGIEKCIQIVTSLMEGKVTLNKDINCEYVEQIVVYELLMLTYCQKCQ